MLEYIYVRLEKLRKIGVELPSVIRLHCRRPLRGHVDPMILSIIIGVAVFSCSEASDSARAFASISIVSRQPT